MMSWAKLLLLVVVMIMTSRSVSAQSAQDNVLTFHGSPDRRGNFTVPGLTWQRAKSLHMDEKFHARVAGNVYAQPLHWRAGGSGSGMLLVPTEENNVHALDATTGDVVLARSLGTPVPRTALRLRKLSPRG